MPRKSPGSIRRPGSAPAHGQPDTSEPAASPSVRRNGGEGRKRAGDSGTPYGIGYAIDRRSADAECADRIAIDADRIAIDADCIAIDADCIAIDADRIAIDAHCIAIDADRMAIDTD